MILNKTVLLSTFATLSVASVVLFGCSTDRKESVEHLFYTAVFTLDDSTSVSVLAKKSVEGLVVKNGAERIFLKSQGPDNYSVPVFGGALVGEWSDKVWKGEWIDSLRTEDYRVKLEISPLNSLRGTTGGFTKSTWDTSIGKLKLTHRGDSAWGTFMTSTGDFRYQAGKIDTLTNRFKLQNFDGVHLFYFGGEIKGDSIINGEFKSGIHYSTSWNGERAINENVTWSPEQEWGRGERVEFQGVNSNGDTEIWSQSRLLKSGYKMLVVDVMGTWCPNCMDEARLLKELSVDYPEVCFVSVAFERFQGNDALQRIAGFKKSMSIPWEILHGGSANKSEADSCLAFFGGVKSFPTTAFIPVDGDPVIHSGFSGPATGKAYEEEVAFFRETIETLLKN